MYSIVTFSKPYIVFFSSFRSIGCDYCEVMMYWPSSLSAFFNVSLWKSLVVMSIPPGELFYSAWNKNMKKKKTKKDKKKIPKANNSTVLNVCARWMCVYVSYHKILQGSWSPFTQRLLYFLFWIFKCLLCGPAHRSGKKETLQNRWQVDITNNYKISSLCVYIWYMFGISVSL